MNWDAIGAVAELLGAVGVIASLVYLATQIRGNTAAVKAESRRQENNATYAYSIIENPDVARVWVAGLTGETRLSSEDATRFGMLLGMLVADEDSYYEEVMLGVGSADRLEQRRHAMIELLSMPGGRRFWKSHCHKYGAEFRAYVEAGLASAVRSDGQRPAAEPN